MENKGDGGWLSRGIATFDRRTRRSRILAGGDKEQRRRQCLEGARRCWLAAYAEHEQHALFTVDGQLGHSRHRARVTGCEVAAEELAGTQ